MDVNPLLLLFAVAAGYLLGSIPFGLVITRLAGMEDIRKTGSGNIGATNVLRTGRKGLAFLTLIADGGKGAAAVLIGAVFHPLIGLAAGTAAFFGHLFPVWLGFKGGKGVATFLGTLLAIYFPVGALVCMTWLATAAALRYSSLSALVASALAPVYFLVFDRPAAAGATAFLAALIFWRHKSNISRLLSGDEPKIGAKASAPAQR